MEEIKKDQSEKNQPRREENRPQQKPQERRPTGPERPSKEERDRGKPMRGVER